MALVVNLKLSGELSDVDAKMVLNVIKQLHVFSGDGKGNSQTPSSTSRSKSYEIAIRSLWHIIADHNADSLNINRKVGHARCHHDAFAQTPKTHPSSNALILGHIRVDECGGEDAHQQLVKLTGTDSRVHKDAHR